MVRLLPPYLRWDLASVFISCMCHLYMAYLLDCIWPCNLLHWQVKNANLPWEKCSLTLVFAYFLLESISGVVKIQGDQGFLILHLSVKVLPCLGSVSALKVCSIIQTLYCLWLHPHPFLLCQPLCLQLTLSTTQHLPKSILPSHLVSA